MTEFFDKPNPLTQAEQEALHMKQLSSVRQAELSNKGSEIRRAMDALVSELSIRGVSPNVTVKNPMKWVPNNIFARMLGSSAYRGIPSPEVVGQGWHISKKNL